MDESLTIESYGFSQRCVESNILDVTQGCLKIPLWVVDIPSIMGI